MDRRNFLTTSSLIGASLALPGCNDSDRQAIDYTKHPKKNLIAKKNININRNKKTIIKLATSWPAHFPIMGTGVDKFAQRVKDVSGGSLEIKYILKMFLYLL